MSNQWGSFFVHGNATQNGIKNMCTVDGNHICEEKTGRREMNTYWGDLIQKYSTLAIPRIDFITGKLIPFRNNTLQYYKQQVKIVSDATHQNI